MKSQILSYIIQFTDISVLIGILIFMSVSYKNKSYNVYNDENCFKCENYMDNMPNITIKGNVCCYSNKIENISEVIKTFYDFFVDRYEKKLFFECMAKDLYKNNKNEESILMWKKKYSYPFENSFILKDNGKKIKFTKNGRYFIYGRVKIYSVPLCYSNICIYGSDVDVIMDGRKNNPIYSISNMAKKNITENITLYGYELYISFSYIFFAGDEIYVRLPYRTNTFEPTMSLIGGFIL